MEDGGLNMRSWNFYEQHYNKPGNLNLHLFPSVERRVSGPFLGRENSVMMNHNGGVFHPMVSEPPMPMDPMKDSSARERFVQQMIQANSSFAGFHEHPGAHSMHMLQQQLQQQLQHPELPKDAARVTMDDTGVKKEDGPPMRKRQGLAAPKPPKEKKPRKCPTIQKENGSSSGHRAKAPKKSMDVVINGIDMDFSSIPIPVCSCTGNPQQCYRWGCGGWQSACCTTTISMYPLPMSTKRRGARIAGRKMSQGAFKKVLEKLASENFSFANPIDLRYHWARHGTNKFVTIR
ncbi:protein BASIC PENTACYSTEINE2-like [Apium graveolens]|uniref:protein BASIC PENTACYSTEINE2-like n=1 Tax=Apium graveolens TaxID=4045 RepID=UPI003D78C08F